MIELREKSTVVTGAAHGIGRAIAEMFAEAGGKVLIADIDDEAGEACAQEIRNAGGDAIFCHANVSMEEDAARAVTMAIDRWGRINVLCNNAAGQGGFHDALHATEEEWQRVFRASLLGSQY